MNPRRIVVSQPEAGHPLAKVLRARLGWSWSEVQRAVAEGKVRVNGAVCRNPQHRLTRGLRLEVTGRAGAVRPRGVDEQKPRVAAKAPPGANAPGSPVIRHADAQMVVVDKPAGLTTMRHPEEAAEFGARARKFLPPTLADLLPELLVPGAKKPPPVFAVHRLDKDTSGLVVFARTKPAEAHLGRQFRAHTIQRRYLALVRGRAISERIESYLIRDRGDGRRGSATRPGEGQRAVTHVHVLEDLGDYTLVECRLETGRTHQVRIHLGERGTPLCGERIYDRPLHGAPLPDRSHAPRLALHAAELGFTHPGTGQPVSWQAPLPRDMDRLLKQLRKKRSS